MTVQSQTDSIGYDGPGSVFSIPFRFLSDGDIRITKAPADGSTPVTLTLTTDYTLVGARQQGGGTATLVVALVAGDSIVIDRGNMQRTQLIDYRANDPFPEEDAEDGLDRLTMLLQQGLLDGSVRSLRLPVTGVDGASAYQGNGNRIADIADAVNPTDVPNLAQVTGLIGPGSGPFIQSGTGAVIRTYQDKARERVSVLDFIPVAEHAAIKAGTSTYDATATIQASINSLTNGGALYFPEGVYRITAELTITANGVTLYGANRQTTTIRQDTLTARCVNITGQYCGISSLGFSYGTGTPLAGATSVRAAGFYGHYRDLVFKRSYVGIEFTINGGQKLRDFECLEYESIGILITAVNDVFVAGGIINAGTTTRGLLGGVRLAEKAEAVILKDIDVLSGKYSITTFATSYAAGSRPAYNKFVACYFDSASDGSLFSQMVESDFLACWWSGGRTGAGFAGLTLTQTDSLKFSNCTWFNNGAQGCLVSATAIRTTFTACSFESNSVTAGSGASHGLQFANSTTNFQAIGCKARNGLGTGSQGYGIFVGSLCDNFSIADCDVSSNVTGGINDGSASTAIKRISGNIGYRTQIAFSSTVLVGSSTRVGNHQLPFTPLAEDFTLQVTGDANASGVTRWWISTITSTQFTINVNTAVTGVALPISIQIRSKGA